MKTKQYKIVCPSCKGWGCIYDPKPVSSSTTIVCPACKGAKVVIVTEQEEKNETGK